MLGLEHLTIGLIESTVGIYFFNKIKNNNNNKNSKDILTNIYQLNISGLYLGLFLGNIFPDIDFILPLKHKTLTHTVGLYILLLIFLFIILYIYYKPYKKINSVISHINYNNNNNYFKYYLNISFILLFFIGLNIGALTHLLCDYLLGGKITLFNGLFGITFLNEHIWTLKTFILIYPLFIISYIGYLVWFIKYSKIFNKDYRYKRIIVYIIIFMLFIAVGMDSLYIFGHNYFKILFH